MDSLGHQRVYIGTKRVAPKTDEHKEAVRFTKNKKSKKRDGRQLQGNTLPRTGRRDHIYSSVNDEVSSTLSEGTGNVFCLCSEIKKPSQRNKEFARKLFLNGLFDSLSSH